MEQKMKSTVQKQIQYRCIKGIISICIVLLTALTMGSCQKGDAGPQGPEGQQGATGAVGATGADGTKIYSGTTTPASSLGNTGDFYLNLSNSNLYGPKTASGWGAPVNLKGATGAAGAAGSKIYSGTAVPASTLGVNGDYYLNTATYLFYGPKANNAWPAPINLRGSQGPAGTANVIYSNWMYATNLRDTTIDASALKIADIAAPQLTADIINKGEMYIYFSFGGGVFTLPYTSYAGGKQNTISFIPVIGKFIITRFTADNSGSVSLSSVLQYRYILIPGGVAATANVNMNDYNAVKAIFHLKD